MTRIALVIAVLVVSCTLGCSALVAPDVHRLDLDGGGGGNVDSGTIVPGNDAGHGTLGDPSNCGPSHAVCGQLQVCLADACRCRPPYTDVGGTCIDLGSDPNNCGTPGHVCPAQCSGGVCLSGDCPRGRTSCDGACVDLQRDPGNCGDCGRVCGGNQICTGGECRNATIPGTCLHCPCTECGSARCCALPGLDTPVCIDGGDGCPVL